MLHVATDCQIWSFLRCDYAVQGGKMKPNPEMGETAMQPLPLPAQTADLSISGLCFFSPLCYLIPIRLQYSKQIALSFMTVCSFGHHYLILNKEMDFYCTTCPCLSPNTPELKPLSHRFLARWPPFLHRCKNCICTG